MEDDSNASQKLIDSNDEEEAAKQKSNPILQLHELPTNTIDVTNPFIGITITNNDKTKHAYPCFSYSNTTQ